MSDTAKDTSEPTKTAVLPVRKIRTRRTKRPADAQQTISELSSHLHEILRDGLSNKPARIFFATVQFASKIARILDPDFNPKTSEK